MFRKRTLCLAVLMSFAVIGTAAARGGGGGSGGGQHAGTSSQMSSVHGPGSSHNPIVYHPIHGPGSSHNPIVNTAVNGVVVSNGHGSGGVTITTGTTTGFNGDVHDHRGDYFFKPYRRPPYGFPPGTHDHR